jgi:hypothetical protein
MSSRLDWEKAKAKAKARRRPSGKRKRGVDRQIQMWKFTQRHGIGCFVCKSTEREWAKTGLSDRGPWAICVECVKRKR